MLDAVTTAVATGAAGNIVAYMLTGRVHALRAQIAHIFRHGTERERSAALSAVEDDVVALEQRDESKANVTGRWTSILVAYLAAHPEALRDVETFASASVVNKTMNVNSQHNYGSGVFIGGDNYGSLTSGTGNDSSD